MAQFLEVLNLTDAPGKVPVCIDIFSKTLMPGESVSVPTHLIDDKLRRHERAGQIAIGVVPNWYRLLKLGHTDSLPAAEVQKLLAAKAKPVARPAVPSTSVSLEDVKLEIDDKSYFSNKRKK